MFIKKLCLSKFRNYEQAELSFSSPVTFFLGKNGSGKTSLLEAIYCAFRGQSFHSFVSSEFIKKGEKESKIRLEIKEKEGDSEIQSSFFFKDISLKKEHFYCGKKVACSFFLKKFPCFVFTESSLKCIRQGSQERRDFVESFFWTEEQLQSKKEFYKILKQKRKLLKDYKKELVKEKDFYPLFDAINLAFLEKSKKITKIRLDILKQIYGPLQSICPSFFNSPPSLDFSYQIKEAPGRQPPFQSQSLQSQDSLNSEKESFLLLESIERDLKKKKALEIQYGLPLSGPQKHEILFFFNGEDSRSFCSKGQQRSYILSLLLSHLKSAPQAFLFLDDALLELDEGVQKKFLHFLKKIHCQTFLTNSNIIPFTVEKSCFFHIEKGHIKKL